MTNKISDKENLKLLKIDVRDDMADVDEFGRTLILNESKHHLEKVTRHVVTVEKILKSTQLNPQELLQAAEVEQELKQIVAFWENSVKRNLCNEDGWIESESRAEQDEREKSERDKGFFE